MADSIANFPLREAVDEVLGTALGRCYADYNTWGGQASVIAGFPEIAQSAGVESAVAERVHEFVAFAEAQGVIVSAAMIGSSRSEIISSLVTHQVAVAKMGARIAALVLLHSACERFLWRLVRFGLVANRAQAITWIATRSVTVQKLAEQESERLIDDQIEKWWDELERETLLKKWDRLIGLFGFPERLNDGSWRCDRDMLQHFDEVRHNAVHHDGRELRDFNVAEFAMQLSRAQLVWVVHVALRLKLKVPAESAFLGR